MSSNPNTSLASQILTVEAVKSVEENQSIPAHLGRFLASSVDDPAIEARLMEIPSETTIEERRFLWTGKNNVLEIGPFLGGTTRAIALGMLHHPAGTAGTYKLFTYDRFDSYYTSNDFLSLLQPLFINSILPLSLQRKLQIDRNAKREFFEIFKLIHENQDYFSLINASTGALPDSKDDKEKTSIFSTPHNTSFECVFIDGCKSWYGTSAFFKAIAESVSQGSHIIFQDYGWYTSFWIPAFVEIFKEHFELIAMIDNTYAFSLQKPFTQEILSSGFPDHPGELGADKLTSIFNSIVSEAALRGDMRQVFFGRLQLAGALAFIGEKKKGKEVFLSLERHPISKFYPDILESSRQCPTYDNDINISFEW